MNVNQPTKPLITINEAAELLAVNRNTIRRLISLHEIKGIRITDNRIAVVSESLIAYIQRRMKVSID